MLAKYFYLITSSDESTTNFLTSKNFLANNENSQCNKCGSEMNLYIIRRYVLRKETKNKESFMSQTKRMSNSQTTFYLFFVE